TRTTPRWHRRSWRRWPDCRARSAPWSSASTTSAKIARHPRLVGKGGARRCRDRPARRSRAFRRHRQHPPSIAQTARGGLELPFAPKTIEIGTDDDEPVVRVVINWSGHAAADPNRGWAKSLRLLQRILMTTLADNGKDIRPFANGLTVRACDL